MTRAASPCTARPNISVEDNAREIENAPGPRKQRRDVVALVETGDEDGQVDVVSDNVREAAR